MQNAKFSTLNSGLFDSAKLESEQLRVVTGGGTTWSTYTTAGVLTSSGTDCIGNNYETTFATWIGGDTYGPRNDSNIAHPNDPGNC